MIRDLRAAVARPLVVGCFALLIAVQWASIAVGAERDLRDRPPDLTFANMTDNLVAGAPMVTLRLDQDTLPDLVGGTETLRGAALRPGGLDRDMRTRAFIGGVATKGDLDGDGDMDLVVAHPCALAPHAGLENCCAGRVMVFWSPRELPDVPRTLVEDYIGDWTLIGGCETTELGTRLAVADLNGDGFDDLVAGGLRGWDGFTFSDTCLYGIFGPLAPDAIVDLFTASADFTMCGGDSFGKSLAAGDFDGDGVDDIVVSGSDGLRVFRGQRLVGNVDWTTPDMRVILPTPSRGAPSAENLPLASADVDGDGRDDLLVGLAGGDGEVDLVLGRTPLPPIIDLNVAPPDLAVLGGPGMGLGASVATGRWTRARSWNLVIGAPGSDGPAGARPDAGAVIVLAGLDSMRGVVDLAVTAPTELFHGVDAGDQLGAGRAGRGILVEDASGDGIDDIAAWSSEARGIANISASRRGEISVMFGESAGQYDLWHSQAAPSALALAVPGVTSPWDAAPNLMDDGLRHFYRIDAPAGAEATIFLTKQEAIRTVRISWLDGSTTAVPVDPSTSTVVARPACIRPDGRSATVVAVTPRDGVGDRLGSGLDVRPSLPSAWLPAIPTGGFRDMGDGTYELEVAAAGPGIASVAVEVEGVVLATQPVVSFELGAPLVQASATPRTGPAGTEFAFSATVTDGVAPFALVWDLDGDGVSDTTDVVPLRAFAHPGTFSAVVTVTDSVRCTGRASVFITVER